MTSKPRIAITHLTSAHDVAVLARKLHVTLVVTHFDLKSLPSHVRATLWSEALTFVAPNLRSCEDINAPKAIEFSAPLLQVSRNIYLPQATRFHAPRLARCAYVHAPLVKNPTTPQNQAPLSNSLICRDGWVGVSFRQPPPADADAESDDEGRS